MQRPTRAILPLTLAALPAVLACVLARVSFGASLLDFMPHYDLDQFPYWREMATFAEAGFSGGHYGVNETISTLKGFGPHGVAISTLYGALYALFPWLGYAAIPVFNLAFITLALGFLLWKTRDNPGECLFLGLAVALYPPVLLWAGSSFQDGLHMAGALALAWCFPRLMEAGAREESVPGLKAGAGALLLALCFVRYTWAVCLVPYFYIVLGPCRWRLALASLMGGLVGLACVTVFHQFIPAWYSDAGSNVFLGAQESKSLLEVFWDRTAGNLEQLLSVGTNNRASSVLAMDLALALAGTLGVWAVGAAREGGWLRVSSTRREAILTAAAGLLGLFVLNAVAWVGNGMNMVRLLSAHYLLCLPLTARMLGPRALHPLVLYGALLVPSYVLYYQYQQYPAYADTEARSRATQLREELSQHLKDWKSGNPWDDTVALGLDAQATGVAWLGIPPRYAIQMFTNQDLPRLCRFALLSGGARERALANPAFKALKETCVGTLFLRLDIPAGQTP